MKLNCGYNGDGIPATQAEISFPEGLAIDPSGNVYFSDMGNNRVRIINQQGTIETIAGNGTCGFSGDGGPGSAAQLCGPQGVGIDAKANLYIADGYSGTESDLQSRNRSHLILAKLYRRASDTKPPWSPRRPRAWSPGRPRPGLRESRGIAPLPGRTRRPPFDE